MVRAALASLTIVVALAAAAPARLARAAGDDAGVLPSAPPLPVHVTRLPNGLEVVLHEDHRAPLVTVNLWYRVGSKDEPAGKSGFAHLFEHVMFQGSKHVPEDTYVRYLERAGATDVNGTTHTDRTSYYETVPASRLELALWLESDRMGFLLPHVDGQTFAVQRDVAKNERRQNFESVPYGLVPSFIRAAVYPAGHPYHEMAIGNGRDLQAATVGDVRAFFRAWYVPNNATLVVAGDIEPARTMELVEKYFGPIVGHPVPERRTAPMPVLAAAADTRLDVRAGVELARVYVTWSTPAFFAPGDAELDLLARALTGGKTSRLYAKLVHEKRVAEDVSAAQSSSELGSMFEITATAQPGHGAAELLAAIDEELARLRKDGVTDAELARAKTAIVTGRIFEVERGATRANLFNLYDYYVHRPDFFADDLARYRAPTPSTIRDAAVRWLPQHARVVTVVTPTKGAPVGGEVVR
jgi:predicted Zn-dependent peptidase